MAFKKPSARQAQFLGHVVKKVTSASMGGRVWEALGSAIKTGVKVFGQKGKKGGFGRAVAEAGKLFGKKTLAAVFRKKPPDFDTRYNRFVSALKRKHGKDVRIPSKKTWAKGKVPGVDYDSPHEPEWDKMGNPIFRPAQSWMKRHKRSLLITGASGATLGFGYGADKSNLGGGVEVRGVKVQGGKKYLHVENPEGHGRRLDLGLAVSGKKAKYVDTGISVGFGKSRSAGIAHAAGAHLKVNTPFVKTDLGFKQQSAFGTKKRSRRVAAIRRAIFSNEGFLDAAKLTKKQRASDSL
jgi:hypothetical protein